MFNRLAGSATKLITRSATIESIDVVTPSFRRISLSMEGKPPTWNPGCKVQIALSPTVYRTLTPFAWAANRTSLLVYRSHVGPLSDWLGGLQAGDAVRVFGPRRSLSLDFSGPPILVGDETSFGLAAAWSAAGAEPIAQFYEVTSSQEAGSALRSLDLPSAHLVERSVDDEHHRQLAALVVDAVTANRGAPLVLTGRAQTIKVIRHALKDAGLRPESRVKAYWDTNRTGLD